jgi:hypothetical protein
MKKYFSPLLLSLLATAALVGCGGGDSIVQTPATSTTPTASTPQPSTALQGTTAADVASQLVGSWSGTCGQSAANSVFSIVYSVVSGSSNSVRSQTSHKFYAAGTNCTGAVSRDSTADNLIVVDGFDTVGSLPVVRYSYGSFSAGAAGASNKATMRLAGTPFVLTEGTGPVNAAGYPTALAATATATKQ